MKRILGLKDQEGDSLLVTFAPLKGLFIPQVNPGLVELGHSF